MAIEHARNTVAHNIFHEIKCKLRLPLAKSPTLSLCCNCQSVAVWPWKLTRHYQNSRSSAILLRFIRVRPQRKLMCQPHNIPIFCVWPPASGICVCSCLQLWYCTKPFCSPCNSVFVSNWIIYIHTWEWIHGASCADNQMATCLRIS